MVKLSKIDDLMVLTEEVIQEMNELERNSEVG